MHDSDKISAAVEIASRYSGCDGEDHKQWVIDQMLRKLLSKKEYEQFVDDREAEENYESKWNTGIPP